MDQAQVQARLMVAIEARRAGRVDEAVSIFREVIAAAGEQPLALNALGLHAMTRGDFKEAEALLRRAVDADPASPDLRMNLARALREQGNDAAEAQILRSVLATDQRHFMALVRIAELHERRGEMQEAADRWSGVLAMAPMIDDRSPALEMMLDHARDVVVRQRDAFSDAIERGLAMQRGQAASVDRRRFDACVDHALGRRAIYANQCAGMHFPFLPADEFFARTHFPWIAEIEAQTGVIRAEFEAALAEDGAMIRPYVAMEPGTPANKWSSLNHSLAWGALHLWKDGRRDDEVCARFPRTAAAVEALPLCDLAGRTPTVFFSLLRPGAHLPAHTGVSNVRTIIHLPLIVPPGCSFRVGGETRTWREGEAWAFDDTIEHEAWNRSDQMRAILIFDVWNPYLTPVERDLLRRFYVIAADTAGAPAGAIGISE